MFYLVFITFSLLSFSLWSNGITVDLRNPEYSEGVLRTHQGGVVKGPDLRLQARDILYTHKTIKKKPITQIEAEGDLLVEFGDYIFVGERLEYDFEAKTGIIYEGRTAFEPWFLGGRLIYLEADGSYFMEDAFLTTSENYRREWQIKASETTVVDHDLIRAKNVQFQLGNMTFFWLPLFKTSLESIMDSPIRYSFRWGGRQGPRASMVYEFFSWRRLKTFLRLDWRLNRGIGVGFETHVRSKDRKEIFETINYIAQDSSIVHPNERLRYRYQGIYQNLLVNGKLSTKLSWDKLSDKYMATDYKDKGLELDTAGRTQFHARWEEPLVISNFYTRIRVNPFQTVKQELPSIESRLHPFPLSNLGLITDCKVKASYLDFKYSDSLIQVHNYHSVRLEVDKTLYRPFRLGPLNCLPEVGGELIYYDNSPQHISRWLLLGKFGFSFNSRLYRYYDSLKHVIIPYTSYHYYTYPTTSPYDHYIFDIEDGWYRLNLLRFGIKQSFYIKSEDLVQRLLYLDIFSQAFFDTPTMPHTIPKIYGQLSLKPTPYLKYIVDTAWDFRKHCVDHFNFRIAWTFNDNLALSCEYRHRDAYDWRKADHTNFILDSFRTSEELRRSQLSDRRDTFLLHLFYRFNPTWALEFESRQGWHRLKEPKYIEFEVDLLTTLRSAWHLKWSYRYREDDKFRIAVSLNVGINKPDSQENSIIPCLEF